jgi:hypothetical protein
MALTKPRASQIYNIDYKQATRVVTVSNVTLAGGAPNQVDGVTISTNDRVLVTGQSTASENGIYFVFSTGTGSNGTWKRGTDSDATGEVEAGTIIMVTEGTTYADTQWKLTTNNPIVIGTTALTFVQNYSTNSISAGTSNVVVGTGANITISASNTSNVLVIANTGAYLTGLANVTYTPATTTGYALQLNAANTIGGPSYGDFLQATNTSTGTTSPNKSFRINNIGTLELINSAYTSAILSVSDTGALTVGGGAAASANNDPTTNYLGFNSKNAVIYDDGNFHIHARGNGSNMWINASNAAIILGNQATTAGGAVATGVVMGSSSTLKAYLSVYGSKSYTISTYGYLTTSGAGTGGGTTASYSIYSDNRMNAAVFDATSDERAKTIQGTIPLDRALKFVREVDGLLYTWNDLAVDNDPGLKAGFSAQRVHKAGFDHMIGIIENEKMKKQVDDDGWVHPAGHQLTMGYNQAVPYHHEVIKHLLDRIEQLEATVAKLTNDKGA